MKFVDLLCICSKALPHEAMLPIHGSGIAFIDHSANLNHLSAISLVTAENDAPAFTKDQSKNIENNEITICPTNHHTCPPTSLIRSQVIIASAFGPFPILVVVSDSIYICILSNEPLL
jgi:hypothetical protein